MGVRSAKVRNVARRRDTWSITCSDSRHRGALSREEIRGPGTVLKCRPGAGAQGSSRASGAGPALREASAIPRRAEIPAERPREWAAPLVRGKRGEGVRRTSCLARIQMHLLSSSLVKTRLGGLRIRDSMRRSWQIGRRVCRLRQISLTQCWPVLLRFRLAQRIFQIMCIRQCGCGRRWGPGPRRGGARSLRGYRRLLALFRRQSGLAGMLWRSS